MDKAIVKEIEINCSIGSAWKAWTTEAGVKSFFAPECRIGSKPDDPYEMYFLPEAAAGSRGGEGNRILAVEPKKLFSFTWNAPPQFKNVRSQRTSVSIRFRIIDPGKTLITLIHTGWGSSDEWQQVYKYFHHAWGNIVLPRLKNFLEGEKIDW